MASNTTYIRVKLDPNSSEFNEVEKLFRKTMKNDKIIVSIELVQHPFFSEAYCREQIKILKDSYSKAFMLNSSFPENKNTN